MSDPTRTTIGQEDSLQYPSEQTLSTPNEICTPEILESIVKGYSKDCELIDFSAKLGTKVGDNYMSVILAVELRIKDRKTGQEEKLHVMLKTMPSNPIRREFLNGSGAFVKEVKMYQEVLPMYEKLQAERGIPASEIFRPWPQCYIAFNEGENDHLAMDDLRTTGYKTANRVLGLNDSHARFVLLNLAKYHALSFATFGGSSSKIMSRFPWLQEKMFLPLNKIKEKLKVWLVSVLKSASDIVRMQGHMREADLMEKLCTRDEFWDYMHLATSGAGREGYVVINHGDCWTNNVLFKYGKDGITPTGLKFVDFQQARCCSRSTDLNYFLHTSIPEEDLNEKEETYLKFYHEEFVSFLARLGEDEDAQKGFTWEGLLEDYNEHKLYGVVMGFLLAPTLSAEGPSALDMEKVSEEEFTSKGAERFFNQLFNASSDKKVVNLAVNHVPRCKLDRIFSNN